MHSRSEASARQDAAAGARDAAGLAAASMTLAGAAWRWLRPGVPVRAAALSDRLVGSLLLAGQGPTAAAAMWRAASRQVPGGELALRAVPEAEWRIDELSLMVQLRLFSRDWRGLPGMPDRSDQGALGPVARKRLRHAQAVLVAFSARDAATAKKAIAAIGRDESAIFSILAYALYREARGLGIPVVIPRKYDF